VNGKRMIVVGSLVVAVAVGALVPMAMAQVPVAHEAATTFDSPVPEPPGEEFPPVPDVDTTGVQGYVAAVGVGAIITVIIEILKRVGAVPDGAAGRWATIANIVAFAGLTVAGVFGVDYSGDSAQAIFDLVHRVGQAILMIISSPLFHGVMREANILPALADRE